MPKYASEYYDPVKAHEYYMRHRKLKGRRKKTALEMIDEPVDTTVEEVSESKPNLSMKGLNAAGRAAAKKAKEQIKEQKKQTIERAKEKINGYIDTMKSNIESIKQKRQGLSDRMKVEREKLQEEQAGITEEAERIRNMPKGPAKDRAKEALKKKREALKGKRADYKQRNEQTKKDKQKLMDDVKKMRGKIKEARKIFSYFKKKCKTHYDNKYAQALDKIRSNPAAQAKKKGEK